MRHISASTFVFFFLTLMLSGPFPGQRYLLPPLALALLIQLLRGTIQRCNRQMYFLHSENLTQNTILSISSSLLVTEHLGYTLLLGRNMLTWYLNILPVLNQSNKLKAHLSPISSNCFDTLFNLIAYSWLCYIIYSKCALSKHLII